MLSPGKMMEIFLLFLHISLMALATASAHLQRGIQYGRFWRMSCFDVLATLTLEAVPSCRKTASTLLGCAASCNQNHSCGQALFHPFNRTCDHFINVSKIRSTHLRPSRWQNDSCVVLTKVKDGLKESEDNHVLWQPLEFEKLTMIETFKVPVKVIETHENDVRISHASHLSGTVPSNLIVSTFKRELAVSKDGQTIRKPLQQPVSYLFWGNQTTTCKMFDTVGNFLSEKQSYNMSTLLQKNLVVEHGSPKNMTVADSVEEASAFLLKGYRRVGRNPARCEIDHVKGDISFDMTETFSVNSAEDVEGERLYFTSVKESLKEGKRFIFQHQINNGSSLPVEELQADDKWILDTSWTIVEPMNDSESLVDALARLMVEGREFRLVLGDKVSTDIVTIKHKGRGIVANLAKYLVPFKGDESKDVTQRVRMPVFGVSKRLIECEKEFQGSIVNDIKATFYQDSAKWFVSTRNWTLLLKMNSKKEVTHGSHESLFNATKDGYNIRLCLTNGMKLLATYCYSSASISLVEMPFIVYKTNSWLYYSHHSNGTLDSVYKDCRQRFRLVGSAGWVQTVTFMLGTKEESVARVKDPVFEWFAELN